MFISGVTTAADWLSLRTAPAPWAEFEFDNIILTVPSDVVRKLERPDEVAALWNDIMKGIADLAVIPHKFSRKERMVADEQISVGKCVLLSHSQIFKKLLTSLERFSVLVPDYTCFVIPRSALVDKDNLFAAQRLNVCFNSFSNVELMK